MRSALPLILAAALLTDIAQNGVRPDPASNSSGVRGAPFALYAQSNKTQIAPSDWPMFNRDPAGTRYSPLTQITSNNVTKLTEAWTYKFNRPGKPIKGDSPSELYQEITPIVVNGVMYMPSGDRVVALEPETGKEIWVYEVAGGKLASFRGVSYWAETSRIRRASYSPPGTRWWG